MLREPTQSIWQALSVRPERKGFILVGGSALALHLNHRISEDLDFVRPETRLPRDTLRQLTNGVSALSFDLRQAPRAEREGSRDICHEGAGQRETSEDP